MSGRTLSSVVRAVQRLASAPGIHEEARAAYSRVLLLFAAVDEGSAADVIALFELAKPAPDKASDMEDFDARR